MTDDPTLARPLLSPADVFSGFPGDPTAVALAREASADEGGLMTEGEEALATIFGGDGEPTDSPPQPPETPTLQQFLSGHLEAKEHVAQAYRGLSDAASQLARRLAERPRACHRRPPVRLKAR